MNYLCVKIEAINMLLPYLNENLIEAGCDEAGRGCLAGAVYAAAVILPKDFKNELLNDSKQLSEKQRYALREVIEKEAIAWAVGVVSPEEIDEINILNAAMLAMKQADCSVAFSSGAQAASQLGSLVLLNNDFAAMPGIVAEGRRVINNIQRAATLFLVKNIFSLFLSVISLFTDWPYPLQPMHLTVISALTIGIPSFFLAMEPNYDRVTGHFLRGVLRRAFPGGLTNVFAVLVCQAFMVVFGLPAASIATVCAGILAVVGMMVLFQVCKPFGTFRRIVWGAMLVCLIVVFTCLGELFELRSGTVQTNLLMLTLLLMTPTVFFAIQRLFDWGEKIFRRVFRRETA